MATLAGRRVVITRPAAQAEETAGQVAARGGEPVVWPLLRIAPPADPRPLERALVELDRYHWLALTSANAAEAVLAAARRLGLGPPSGARVACVGGRTAAVVRAAGWPVHLVPPRADGAALAEALLRAGPPGARVLLPRSDQAPPDLPAALRAGGLEPVEVEAYRTVPVAVAPDDPVLAAVRDGAVDAVLLFSGSAARALAAALGAARAAWAARPPGQGRPLVACLGRPTAAAAAGAGLPVDVVAPRAEGGALLDAVGAALAETGGLPAAEGEAGGPGRQ